MPVAISGRSAYTHNHTATMSVDHLTDCSREYTHQLSNQSSNGYTNGYTNGFTEDESSKNKSDPLAYRRFLLGKFLQAMKEDLAEWINSLSYGDVQLNANNFMTNIDNGVLLCQQARLIQRFIEEYVVLNPDHQQKVPCKMVYYTEKGALAGSFVARDNVANFISWCRELEIAEVVLFESEDLVLHKNEKNVILTILDVARKAFQFGVQPPELVRFEDEIDREIERDKVKPPPQVVEMEEDNDLDTLVQKIVNRCECGKRFPIKKLADGKYKIGKTDTLIFVRIMRKHVMVRVGGGWDTLEHYVEKHDPCRTQIGGNITNNGLNTAKLSSKEQNSISPIRKMSRVEPAPQHAQGGSQASSDTWSMCSSETGSTGSAGEGTNRSNESCRCPDDSSSSFSTPSSSSNKKYNIQNQKGTSGSHRRSQSQHNKQLNDDTETLTTLKNSAISFTNSIVEGVKNQEYPKLNALDEKLKLLEGVQQRLDSNGMKDTTVYETRGDSWLRSHMNQLKARRISAEQSPANEFVLQRGYSDLVESKSRKETLSSGQATPRQGRGKENKQRGARQRTSSSNQDSFHLEEYHSSPTRIRSSTSNTSIYNSAAGQRTPQKAGSQQSLKQSSSQQSISDFIKSYVPTQRKDSQTQVATPSRIPKPQSLMVQRSRSMGETETQARNRILQHGHQQTRKRNLQQQQLTQQTDRQQTAQQPMMRREGTQDSMTSTNSSTSSSRNRKHGEVGNNTTPQNTSPQDSKMVGSSPMRREKSSVEMRREKSSSELMRLRREKTSDALMQAKKEKEGGSKAQALRREKTSDSIPKTKPPSSRRISAPNSPMTSRKETYFSLAAGPTTPRATRRSLVSSKNNTPSTAV